MLSAAQLTVVEAALVGAAPVDALWVFGSVASGTANAESDVDLAALFAHRPAPEALFRARDAVAEQLGRPVDLVDLEGASPILAMQALRHGLLVLERDRSHRVRFVSGLGSRYEDAVILRRAGEKILRARLSDGRA